MLLTSYQRSAVNYELLVNNQSPITKLQLITNIQ